MPPNRDYPIPSAGPNLIPLVQEDSVSDDDEAVDVSPKTRVAILGCGMMGREHVSYIQGYSKDLMITHLCDPHAPSIDACLKVMQEFTKRDAHDTCLPEVVTEEELLDQASQIDLLVIATPNYLHTDALLRWGVFSHLTILLEKPVAVNRSQHERLSSFVYSDDFKARVWVAMEYRYIPAINQLLQLLPEVGEIQMVTIRENRYPFLHKVGKWNRDWQKTGDTLVEKACHFHDLMRLITGKEPDFSRIHSIIQRGINYQDEEKSELPIIDSAYMILPFASSRAMGCLELCMFAEGSRHQEEIIVTGTKGRVEAYLPENKVFLSKRPSVEAWSNRSEPPPKSAIEQVVFDCSNIRDVHHIDCGDIPTHGGYHYSSTAIEWYRLLENMKRYNCTRKWTPEVSIHDGLAAVLIGIVATEQSI